MGLTSARPHLQPRPKALTPRHRTRPPVVSAGTGETGSARRRAMLAGARAPITWARRRHERGHRDEEPLAPALHGQWRAAPLVAVAQAVAR